MSDNKTPISSVLGIIESRNEFLKRLHFEADEHDKKFIKPRIEENERTLQTLKSHLPIEETIIKDAFDSGVQSQIDPPIIQSDLGETIILTGIKYFNQKFKPE